VQSRADSRAILATGSVVDDKRTAGFSPLPAAGLCQPLRIARIAEELTLYESPSAGDRHPAIATMTWP